MLGMNSEALKRHVDLLLLATLEPAPVHGYGVVEALRERAPARGGVSTSARQLVRWGGRLALGGLSLKGAS